MQNKRVIPCFIDEAGVKKSPAKKCTCIFIGIAPIVAGEHSQHNVVTILLLLYQALVISQDGSRAPLLIENMQSS